MSGSFLNLNSDCAGYSDEHAAWYRKVACSMVIKAYINPQSKLYRAEVAKLLVTEDEPTHEGKGGGSRNNKNPKGGKGGGKKGGKKGKKGGKKGGGKKGRNHDDGEEGGDDDDEEDDEEGGGEVSEEENSEG